MSHTIEISPSSRGACRSCGQKFVKGELRFGADASQPASLATAYQWHHLACAAAHQPAALRPTLADFSGEVPGRDALVQTMDAALAAAAAAAAIAAAAAAAAPRGVPGALPTAELAPTGRAKCIGCEAAVAAKSIRVAVERKIDTGRFVTMGAGYLHPACVPAWAAREGIDLGELIAKVVAHSALTELPAPFNGEAVTPLAVAAVAGLPGTQETIAAPVKQEVAIEPEKELPPLAGVDTTTLREVAKKLDKLFDPNGYKHNEVLERARITSRHRDAVYWYLAEHRLIAPETNAGLLRNLGEIVGAAPKGVIVALLGRLNSTVKELYRDYGVGILLLPRWLRIYDDLAVYALRSEPAALEAAMAAMPPDIRLGVAFVRGRSGLPISDADRKAIFKHLVHVTLTKDARVHFPIHVVTGDSVTTAFELAGPEQLPRLAALFVPGDEAWAKAVAAGLGRGTWTTVAQVAVGLLRVPLDTLVKLVGKRSYLDRNPGSLFAILDGRKDSPAAVFACARVLPADYKAGTLRELRELMLVWALSRGAAAGEPVTYEAASELLLEQLDSSLRSAEQLPLRDGYLAVMRALPRADALALARRQLETEYAHSYGLPILSVHFDDALLREFIAKNSANDYLSPEPFVLIGTAALPALVDAYGAAAQPKWRDALLVTIVAILSQGSGPIDPRELAAIAPLGSAIFDCGDTETYWSQDRRDAVGRLLARIDPERRRELLLAKLQTAAYVARPYSFVPLESDRDFQIAATRLLIARAQTLTSDSDFDGAVSDLGPAAPQIFIAALGSQPAAAALLRRLEKALGDGYADLAAARGIKTKNWLESLTDMCAEADGPRERIYLLAPPYEAKECDLVPRAGSWSQLGGAGPGIAVPTQRSGEPLEHVLTLDLQEVPELTKRYPGARALALYVPDPRGGEHYESSKLVAVPASATPPAGGRPLFVLPLDVPSAIFERRVAYAHPLLSEIRIAIFNRSGWVLGEPMWIQDDEGDMGLIMQLAGGLGLNVGDSGALYVFDGSFVMQSH